MDINKEEIIEKIYTDFPSTYKPFAKFVNSGELWDLCVQTASDAELLNHMIFCNDIMEIPPVKVFLQANTNIVKIEKGFDKKAIGAFWAFIFKETLNYQLQQENMPIKYKGIKKATRYYNEARGTKVVDNTEITETTETIEVIEITEVTATEE